MSYATSQHVTTDSGSVAFQTDQNAGFVTPTLPMTLNLPTGLEGYLRDRYEVSTREFKDNGGEYCDIEYEYDRPGDDQGLVIIFNQELFDNHNPRKGSERDVKALQTTFTKLGFNVKVDHLHEDLSRRQMLRKFDEYAGCSESQHSNSLIVIFMSHGDRENILYTRDGHITVMELIEPFSKPFENKPKLFIIQACKSTEEDMIENEVPQLIFPIYTLPSDLVIYYSTVEGNVSLRDLVDGTWLIDELSKIFLMYGRREDVISLLQRTTKCISILQYNLEMTENRLLPCKQLPVVVSTLQKKFFLSSNRHRENMNIATRNVRGVRKALDKLAKKLNK